MFSRTKDLWRSFAKLDNLRNNIIEAWLSQNIDVVIAPGFVFPAPPIKNPARLVPAISYTCAYNMIDFPAGSMPVTRVIKQDEVVKDKQTKSNLSLIHHNFPVQNQDALEDYPKNDDMLHRLVYEGAKNTVGLPLNVQIVGRPWQEEMVLHAMQELEKQVKYHD